MFNRWQRYSTKRSKKRLSAPVQLRFLLAAAVECNAQGYILRLAVLSSPHFSDPEFTKTLLHRLINTIDTTDGEMRKLAMVCFCVLCAIDGELPTVCKARNDE